MCVPGFQTFSRAENSGKTVGAWRVFGDEMTDGVGSARSTFAWLDSGHFRGAKNSGTTDGLFAMLDGC